MVLSPSEFSFAGEVTFGLKGNYSLQLPEGWTAKPTKDGTLSAKGPVGPWLKAAIFESERTAEGLMDMLVTEVTAKKPGYKFLEKGSRKSSAGHNAYLFRFRLEEKKSTEWVEYYFQLAEKEVVLLSFAFRTGTGDSFKGDIDSIFNSVKIGAGSH
jgi:hypothetical protein